MRKDLSRRINLLNLSVRYRPIVLKKSLRDIFVLWGAGIIRPCGDLCINSFQPRYSTHGNFATGKTTDFFNTIAQLQTLIRAR
jgi:hypothetical protein